MHMTHKAHSNRYMKINRYVHYEPIDQMRGLLYNAYNQKSILIDSRLYSIIKNNANKILNIENIYPEFYDKLVNDYFIIPNEIDESKEAINNIEKTLLNESNLTLTINPTMDCNLRCWYCYEDHIKFSRMSDNTLNAIIKFVKNRINSGIVKNLQLSFFGGEPLLYSQKIILPLIKSISQFYKNKNIGFSIMFTTNGILIDSDFLSTINKYAKNIAFQIPFDGNEYLHNQTKKNAMDTGFYRATIENINKIMSFGMRVNIRCNYTIENIDSFSELMNDVKNLEYYDNRICSFSLQKIWQSKDSIDLDNKVSEVINWGKSNNIISESIQSMIPTHCYADYSNSYVINYDGLIYKCTARKFSNENSIGKITDDGNISLQHNVEYYINKRFYTECCNCQVLPICTICHQTHMENNKASCPYNISDDEKLNQIKHHIRISNKKIFNL